MQLAAHIETVTDFATACEQLTTSQIYELFENDIADELRDTILSIAPVDCSEPVRYALNALGDVYEVKSLTDY